MGDDRIKEIRAECQADGVGLWRSCSGCYETNEGYDVGPRSNVFGCHLGFGCRECGGIGAVWDTMDYEAMGDALASGDADLDAEMRRAVEAEREACARLIDENDEWSSTTSSERGVSPRTEGNRSGFGYAAAIRARARQETGGA